MHLASPWHHQGAFREELSTDSRISSIITSSALTPARHFRVNEESWGLPMPQDVVMLLSPLAGRVSCPQGCSLPGEQDVSGEAKLLPPTAVAHVL